MEVRSRLGNLLVQKGIIDKNTLEKALIIQAQDLEDPPNLTDVLVNELQVDHNAVYSTLAEFYAFRSINLQPTEVDEPQLKHTKEILDKFPEDFRKKMLFRKILPWQTADVNRRKLLVLAADVTEKLVENIPVMSEYKKYEILYCPLSTLDELIQMVSPQKNEFLDLLKERVQEVDEAPEAKEKGVDEFALDDEINKSLLVNLFEGCIIEAVRRKASDIHIIPAGRNSVEFYFRVDGKLTLWHRQDGTSPEAMSAVVKDRSSGVDRFERDTAQDGFAQRLVDGHLIRLRVSIVPMVATEYSRNFESVVIRVVDDRNVLTDMTKLGFQEQAERDFAKAIGQTKGLVLLTGPTGSGKSTTLMAALHHVIDPTRNVLTCEDPVEYVIKGARQIKISGRLSFEDAIRSILRHDPDIVMVGEIRDSLTAEVAVKLSNTGHLTFSTLHTNDAPSAISRLYKMGIEPFLLANVINIIVAQRLIRQLCPHCKKTIEDNAYRQALQLGFTAEELSSGNIYQPGPGCKHCNRGYKGRIAVTEALYFTHDIRQAVLESGNEIDEDEIRQIAEKNGMLSLKASAMERVRHGLTSPEEVASIMIGE